MKPKVGKIANENQYESSFILEDDALPPPSRPPKLSMEHGFSELWNELSLPCGTTEEVKELTPAQKRALQKKQKKAEKLEKKKNRESMKLLQNLKIEDLTVLTGANSDMSPIETNPKKKKKHRKIGGTLMRKKKHGSFASVGSVKSPSTGSKQRHGKTKKKHRASYDELGEDEKRRRMSSFMDNVRSRLSMTFTTKTIESLKVQSAPPEISGGGDMHV